MQDAALVVGIDQYDYAPALSGTVSDALEMVEWLLSIGVPPDRIRLHLAPIPADPNLLHGIIAQDATRQDIWNSILAIRSMPGQGRRLYVLLSGHGFYLAEGGPVFLCRDWSPDDNPDRNLGIYAHADFFCSLSFKDQFLVLDACQNYDIDSIYRSNIPPGLPPTKSTIPDPANGLTLCCAASQGQLAIIDQGRGLLTRNLLAALRAAGRGQVPAAAQDSLVLDWQSGDLNIDLRPLFQYVVSQAVIQGATLQNVSQTPTIQPRGRATTEPYSIIQDVSNIKLSSISVDAVDSAGVDVVRLELRPPVRELHLPPLPFKGFAPSGSQVIAMCIAHNGWDASPPLARSAGSGLSVKFDVKPVSAPPATASPELTQFNLRVIDSKGHIQSVLTDTDYSAAGVQPDSLAQMPSQPLIVPHEYGPDISWRGVSIERANVMAETLSDQLSERLSRVRPDLQIMISPPGRTVHQSRPNLRIRFQTRDSRAIAGYLTDEPLIKIERIGGPLDSHTVTFSVAQLMRRPLIRLFPGAYRLVADMPWGLGVSEVEVDHDGIASCPFPEVPGRRPLRNLIAAQGFARFDHGRNGVGYWVAPGTDGESEKPVRFADLSSTGEIAYLLLEKAGPYWRAEPYSSVASLDWDLIFGAGRLDAIHLPEALHRLSSYTSELNQPQLIRIALAYAARSQGNSVLVQTLLSQLPSRWLYVPDVQLLQARTDAEPPQILQPPLLRWGVELMRQRSMPVEFPGMLSPISTWTVFQDNSSN
jgi:hypothetical protein